LVPPRTYEITFAGQAGAVLRAEFDDCEITIGPGTTTLRAELPDPAALSGLVQRITGLRLEVVLLHLVPPSPPLTDLSQTRGETRLAPSHPEELGLPVISTGLRAAMHGVFQ
jgi:hypothetical protein